MKAKKFVCLLLVLAMALSLAACSGGSGSGSASSAPAGSPSAGTEATPAADQPVTLVCGNVATGDTNPYNMCMNWAKEYLEKKGSTVTLDLQLQGVMGSETEQCQQVILGTQDIAQTADMSTTNFVPKMAFANFPMLFESYDDVYEGWAQEGWCFELASEILDEAGLVLLGAGDNGFRLITNSKREITCMDDMAGLKIRVPEVALLLDIWNQFGCQTAPIAFGELTTALQQGTVDGQELGLQHFYSNRWDEFNKYLSQINYDYSAFIIFINKDTFHTLSAQQQQDLMDAFAYGCENAIDYSVDFIQKGLETMIADGLIDTPVSEEFRDQIYEVGYNLAHTDKWMGVLGEDLVNSMYPSATRR